MNELTPWLRLLWRHPARLVIGALLMSAVLLAGVGLLALSGWFITGTALAGALLAAGTQVAFDVYKPGSGIRAFALTRTVARYLERVYNHDTVLRLLAELRTLLFRRFATQGLQERARLRSSEGLSRLTGDVDALDTLYLRLVAPTAVAAATTLLVLGLTAWFYSPTLALAIGVLLVAALLLATLATYGATRRLSRQQSDQQETLRTVAVEHLDAMAELTAFQVRSRHAGRLQALSAAQTDTQATLDSRSAWHQAGVQLCVHLAVITALILGVMLYQSGEISGPVLVLLPLALLALGEGYSMLPDAFARLGATCRSAERMNRIATENPDDARNIGEPGRDEVLLMRDVCIAYPGDPPILADFSLTLREGEHVAILGRSGSGKSTLADMAAGLIPVETGVCSRAVAGNTVAASYLPQRTQLFEDTLAANLRIGNPESTDTQLWAMLERLELGSLAESLSDGLESWLGPYGSSLSGGEARRVALARTLLCPAPLVILDEPFTGVDGPTLARIAPKLRQCLQGRTVLLFGHDRSTLPPADRYHELA